MKPTTVMAGLVPAIHVFLKAAILAAQDVDARHKAYARAGQRPDPRAGHDAAFVAIARLYIGRTSTTSGTKCLSRFWMPCLSVAVEDGQPEHAPFMLR